MAIVMASRSETQYKPAGYNSASPYLVVDDPEKTLAFLKAVFGCEVMRTHRGDDGSIVHTEVRVDDSVIMIGGAPRGPQAHVHVYVEDIDDAFARAVKAGGTVVQELERKDDGDRRGGVKDPGGTTWWLSRQEPGSQGVR